MGEMFIFMMANQSQAEVNRINKVSSEQQIQKNQKRLKKAIAKWHSIFKKNHRIEPENPISQFI